MRSPPQFEWTRTGASEIAQHARLRDRYALLTPRERQVMALVASGLMNKQVANELSISEVTVKMHRGSVMRKLGRKIRRDARADRGGARHPEVRRVPAPQLAMSRRAVAGSLRTIPRYGP